MMLSLHFCEKKKIITSFIGDFGGVLRTGLRVMNLKDIYSILFFFPFPFFFFFFIEIIQSHNDQ